MSRMKCQDPGRTDPQRDTVQNSTHPTLITMSSQFVDISVHAPRWSIIKDRRRCHVNDTDVISGCVRV